MEKTTTTIYVEIWPLPVWEIRAPQTKAIVGQTTPALPGAVESLVVFRVHFTFFHRSSGTQQVRVVAVQRGEVLVACVSKQCISNSPMSTTNFVVDIVEFETHYFSTKYESNTHRFKLTVWIFSQVWNARKTCVSKRTPKQLASGCY